MASRNDPLGYDLACRDDIDRAGRSSSGVELALDAIHHRLTTDSLPLIDSEDGNVNFGENIFRWLGESIDADQVSARAAGLGSLLENDERMPTVDVTAENVETNSSGLISFDLMVNATLATGTSISARVGVSVSGVTVELLSQGR